MKPDSKANEHRTLILSLVVVAGLVWNAMVVGVLPHARVVSTLAGSGIGAVDHVLNREVGRRPRTFSLYVDSICRDKKSGFVGGIRGWLHTAISVQTLCSAEPVTVRRHQRLWLEKPLLPAAGHTAGPNSNQQPGLLVWACIRSFFH